MEEENIEEIKNLLFLSNQPGFNNFLCKKITEMEERLIRIEESLNKPRPPELPDGKN